MSKTPRKAQKRTGRPHRPGSHETHRPRFSREVAVLFEDEALVVLDKPAGLLAVPIPGSKTLSAFTLLDAALRERRERAFVVHRIDRFVSGLMVFAKTNADRNELVRQFLAHTPVRDYLAVVRGRIEQDSGTLVHYFRRAGMHQYLESARDSRATRAELHYSVERRFADASLVRVELVTGLQNQIRAQFAAIGHPVIGDRKYHPQEASEPEINRVALHAAHLEFQHPRTGEPVYFDCEMPEDFRLLLRRLSLAN
jgi:23S rRNA pseudouridine1911/1915/1917 synthase